MNIVQRIRRAFTGSDRSSDQIAGGTVRTEIGLGQIAAVERREFPPEEFASDERDESE